MRTERGHETPECDIMLVKQLFGILMASVEEDEEAVYVFSLSFFTWRPFIDGDCVDDDSGVQKCFVCKNALCVKML